MVRKELNEVHFLRGAASLMVCLFHFTLGNEALFPSSNWFEKFFSYGYLGVEIFFILSGYVICYSLPDDFTFHHWGTFFKKRIVRIEPPYIVSIVLVLLLNFLSHKITGLPNQINYPDVISHLAYINNFNPATYVNVVYWTLGIEAQFYVLIALLFPFIRTSKYMLLFIAGASVAIACIRVPGSISVILPYLSYFAIGIVLFFYKIKRRLGLPLFFAFVSLSLIQIIVFTGAPGAVAAFVTVLILLYWNYANRIIKFFSMISYSLYLIHSPVGGKVINLGMRYVETDFSKYALVFLATIISICFAFVFYKVVELPAFRLSKRFRYRVSENTITASVHNDNKLPSSNVSIGSSKIAT